MPWTAPLLREKPIWEISYGGALALTAVMLAGLLLTWWARIYLGPLWSSVITCKKHHRIVDTGPRPFLFGVNGCPVRPDEALGAYANSVADRFSAALDQIKEMTGGSITIVPGASCVA